MEIRDKDIVLAAYAVISREARDSGKEDSESLGNFVRGVVNLEQELYSTTIHKIYDCFGGRDINERDNNEV